MATAAQTHQPVDSRVHHAILRRWIDTGICPTIDVLADELSESRAGIAASLARLEANHGVVLDPARGEVWLTHPFSTTPTLFHITDGERSWWAPCIWCALGAAVLIPRPTRIHTRIGGEHDDCVIEHDGGRLTPSGLIAHLPVPIARAWDNVHRHCACALVFERTDQVEPWCARHGIERGAIVTVEKLLELSQVWYGRHADPDWRKPTADEARASFASVGLTDAHWSVPGSDSRF